MLLPLKLKDLKISILIIFIICIQSFSFSSVGNPVVESSDKLVNEIFENTTGNLGYYEIIEEFRKNSSAFIDKLSKSIENPSKQNSEYNDSKTYNSLFINGTARDYFTNQGMTSIVLFFKLESRFTASLDFESIIGFSFGIWGNFKLNKTSTNLSLSESEYIGYFAIGMQGSHSDYFYISNITINPVVHTGTNTYGIYNLRLKMIQVTFIGVSGISHLNDTKPDYIPILEGSGEAAILHIQAYNENKSILYLDQPVFYTGFAAMGGSRDIMGFLPINLSLHVEITLYTKEVGWLLIEKDISPLGYSNSNISFLLIPIHIADSIINSTKLYKESFISKGYNLDRYEYLLTEANQNWNQCQSDYELAEPLFGFQEITWGNFGEEAYFEAEIVIGKCQRYINLVDRYITLLTNEPIENIILITSLLSLVIGLLLGSIIFYERRFFNLLTQYVTTSIVFYIQLTVNPIITESLQINKITLVDNIQEPLFFISFFAVLLLETIFFGLILLTRSSQRVIDLSIRNIRRLKLRTIITAVTLTIVSMSFILLVSVSFQGEILTEGVKRDGEGIDGIEISLQQTEFFGVPINSTQYQRIPGGTEILVNVSLEIQSINAEMLMRDFLTAEISQSDSYQESNLSITNPQTNQTHYLHNYLATIPSKEKLFSNIDSMIIEGNWLENLDNVTIANQSDVIITEELATELNLNVDDNISFNFVSNGVWTNASFFIRGILNYTALENVNDINGDSIIPKKYEIEESIAIDDRICSPNEFIIFNFQWWSKARAESFSADFEFARISKIGPKQIILNTTLEELGFDLADRLEGYTITLAKEGFIYNLQFSIQQKIEGLIPQIFPLLLAIPIVSQLVWNSFWKRRKEIQLYTNIGFSYSRILSMIVLEYILIAIIAGALGYLLAISIFPVLEIFNMTQYLSQKTESFYTILAVVISISSVIISLIPILGKTLYDTIPKKEKDPRIWNQIALSKDDIEFLRKACNSQVCLINETSDSLEVIFQTETILRFSLKTDELEVEYSNLLFLKKIKKLEKVILRSLKKKYFSS